MSRRSLAAVLIHYSCFAGYSRSNEEAQPVVLVISDQKLFVFR
jgi:hypothetical protein